MIVEFVVEENIYFDSEKA